MSMAVRALLTRFDPLLFVPYSRDPRPNPRSVLRREVLNPVG